MNLNRKQWNRRGVIRLIPCILVLALSACQPAAQPKLAPTPVIVEVQVTPALYLLTDIYQSCANALPGMGLVLIETPAQAVPENLDRLVIYWGEYSTPPAFSAVLGEEALVVVVHPENPLTAITVEELRAIYLGKQTQWSRPANPGEIEPWAYPSGEDAQAVFQRSVMNVDVLPSHGFSLVPHPAAMREAVSGSSAAIGFLPARWVDSSVKAVTIAGAEASRITAPVLALKNSPPGGLEKEWLLCVQENLQ